MANDSLLLLREPATYSASYPLLLRAMSTAEVMWTHILHRCLEASCLRRTNEWGLPAIHGPFMGWPRLGSHSLPWPTLSIGQSPLICFGMDTLAMHQATPAELPPASSDLYDSALPRRTISRMCVWVNSFVYTVRHVTVDFSSYIVESFAHCLASQVGGLHRALSCIAATHAYGRQTQAWMAMPRLDPISCRER